MNVFQTSDIELSATKNIKMQRVNLLLQQFILSFCDNKHLSNFPDAICTSSYSSQSQLNVHTAFVQLQTCMEVMFVAAEQRRCNMQECVSKHGGNRN